MQGDALQLAQELPGLAVPYDARAVLTASNGPNAVGEDCNGPDHIGMALQSP